MGNKTIFRWRLDWLLTDYAKSYCNRTPIVKVTVENVVTCFLGGHSVVVLRCVPVTFWVSAVNTTRLTSLCTDMRHWQSCRNYTVSQKNVTTFSTIGIDVSLLVINWCINPIVLRVEWWFDGKHFSSLNHMKSNCTSYSSCLLVVRRATRLVSNSCCARRRLTQLPGDRDKLFCVQSVNECQFHMRSHDSIGAFLDCLPDWTRDLRHSQCSRWHTQNTVCHCPVADQSYALFRLSLTEWRYFHILSTCYEPV